MTDFGEAVPHLVDLTPPSGAEYGMILNVLDVITLEVTSIVSDLGGVPYVC